ncbi:radical SAM protein [Methanoculleus sp.]|uniref:radical SAM protein n=1 Tax=Methanoculleus sp. TaxID=90427 RepID=UPI001BD56212|nr:radical SAM protein [Methanoculleus sp.]
MPANFLDLHIVDYCQLACRHCYLHKGNTSMPLEMIIEASTDFLQADLPLPESTIILSGGEPLLHPQFGEVCSIVRSLNGHVALSSNGILVPQYIDLFRKNDGIQISIDGDNRVHDFIRGEGSYEKAVRALRLLDENNIRHSVSFTANKQNLECIDHIIDLCTKTGSYLLNFNLYQPIRENGLDPLSFSDWLSEKQRVKERVEQEGILCTATCVEKGCIAGILGLSVLPDGTYWDCSRNQHTIGKFPQKIRDVLFREHIQQEKCRDQFETCCRKLGYE